MTDMLLLNCALKLVEVIILYYDARSKKHQITGFYNGDCECLLRGTDWIEFNCIVCKWSNFHQQ